MEPSTINPNPPSVPSQTTLNSSPSSVPSHAGLETSPSSQPTQLSTPPSPAPNEVNMDKFGEQVSASESAFLHRHLGRSFPRIAEGSGLYLILEGGRKIIDASGGAAVACIGHGDTRVLEAMQKQLAKVAYCSTTFFTTDVCEELCKYLVDSTHGEMARAYIVNSGSEAMEAAMKLARQFFLEKQTPEPQRINFIARGQSYHGNTLGALSMSGHLARRAKFEPMLLTNTHKVSPCFPRRNKLAIETDETYVARLAAELDAKFKELGPDTVCAFVAEPVVGAALGCATAVPGYFKAMREVCDKHGALLILDEVMCGMGRTGSVHAWQQEDVVPDIQTLGKCLGGGYQPIAGLLIGHKIVNALTAGSGAFMHGHTYQGHPIACAAALEVQKIMRNERMFQNVAETGEYLRRRLHEVVGDHPNVGDIRGRGFFWGIEFVEDKATNKPFPFKENVALELAEYALAEPHNIALYPGGGCANGIDGDHVIVSPPYNTTMGEVEEIVDRVQNAIQGFFALKAAARRAEAAF